MKTIAKWMRWRTKHSVMLREDTTRNALPHDRAWTNRMATIRVPAPMRENTFEIAQPLDSAGSTIKSDAIEVVPAPRLELGTP